MTSSMKRLLPALWLAAALLAALFVSSCSRTPPELATTGKALTRAEMVAAANGAGVSGSEPNFALSSSLYAEVNSKWLAGFIDRYRTDLHDKGVTVSLVSGDSGWDPQFNCTMFVDLYVADAGAELLSTLYTRAALGWPHFSRPAIFQIWYVPDRSKPDPKTRVREGHAIVLVIAENGPHFIDPQVQTATGEVTLTAAEKLTIYHRQA